MTRIRIGRKLLQGLGALGAGFVTYKAVSSEEGLDIYNVGVARFGRAAIAVRTKFHDQWEGRFMGQMGAVGPLSKF